MSEKRLIDFETLGRIINIFKLAPETNLNDVFDELSKPTLADVTGTRTLDSMTEEEFVELMNVANLELDRIDKNPDDNSASVFKNYSIIKTSGNELEGLYWEDGMDELYEKELSIEPGLVFIRCFPVRPRETIKWFLEKGFNVWEGK